MLHIGNGEPSVVLDNGWQPFGVGHTVAVKKIDMFISQPAQGNKPRGAPVIELRPSPRVGVIFEYHHGGLMLLKGPCLLQKVINLLPGRGGRLQHLAVAAIQRLNDERRVVGLVKRDRRARRRAGSQNERQDRKCQKKPFIHGFTEASPVPVES